MTAPFALPAPAAIDAARALHARRALEQALDHGAALLAALGLPRLVDEDFAPIDHEAAGEALSCALALLDAIDPDPDLEPSLGAPEKPVPCFGVGSRDSRPAISQAFWSDGGEPDGDREEDDDPDEDGGDDELDLGWAANVRQIALGPNTADGDLTALERPGMGFVRCGADDAEDDDSGIADMDGLIDQMAAAATAYAESVDA